jgi:hypothetical protein
MLPRKNAKIPNNNASVRRQVAEGPALTIGSHMYAVHHRAMDAVSRHGLQFIFPPWTEQVVVVEHKIGYELVARPGSLFVICYFDRVTVGISRRCAIAMGATTTIS